MQFDEQFLQDMGLNDMPEEQKKAFLDYAQEELEVRIGEKISEGLSEEQLSEFDAIENQNLAVEWLEKNRPDYKEIVATVVDELKGEISANKEQILA
ncbi:hypothetical protein IJI94_01660 [Candidatus Saccharibacteria bacterium]|nr:hypothetical protein [Candidatus Saccharibacteria bacterium]